MLTTQFLTTKLLTRQATRFLSSTHTVVQIDFKDIMKQDRTLFSKFEEAYGDEGVGALVVNNIPEFPEKRKKLLPYAQMLSKLERKALESLESPENFYSVGWSHGREKFQGKPDLLKASYYACPLSDKYQMVGSGGEIQNISNKWPEKGVISGFESAFKDLGKYINLLGIEVAKNLDKYIKARCDTYEEGQIESHLRNSTRTTGRLLHYFPVSEDIDITDMKWCGWHNDHGTLTGLCSAMYLDHDFNEIPPSEIEDDVSGLFAMTRNHQEIKIKIPQDSLAFQIGECAQIISGGLLCATPHSVVCKPNTDGISRNTFALFLEPNPYVDLKVPRGMDP